MKYFSIFVVIMALLSMSSCNNNNKADSNPTQEGTEIASEPKSFDPFEAFAEHFSDTVSFAYAEISGRKVLLVSQETFGNNINADKEAIEATIFALIQKIRLSALVLSVHREHSILCRSWMARSWLQVTSL